MSEKKIRWTPSQNRALEARDVGLAVSAAAGSGKTAVLTERIVRLLSEPHGVDVAGLCVVTFTKAAAGELEAKLYEALTAAVAAQPKNKRLARQLFRLDQAHISTIDSFCLDLIRAYRQELGLRPGVRVCDETEEDLLFREAREEGLDAFLSDPENREAKERFYALFCTAKNRDGLWAVLEAMKDKADCSADGISFFRNRLTILARETEAVARGGVSFYETRHGRQMFQAAEEALESAVLRLNFLIDSIARYPALDKRLDDFQVRLAALEEVRDVLRGGEAVRAGLLLTDLAALELKRISGLSEEEKAEKAPFDAAWKASRIR